MSGERPKVSACVITLNEERNIESCLASLAWCDDLVVVDSGSSDRTRELAAAHGARVFERDWPGYAPQKQRAVELARHDWILSLDADERLSPELQQEIARLQAGGFSAAAAWSLPRCSRYLGAWIRHGTWYPDRSVRLFDRRRARWQAHPQHAIHERVVVDGPVARLQADLLHEPFRDISEHLATIDRYTTAIAQGLYAQGRRARWWDLTLHPLAEALRFLVLKQGVRDGWRGLVLGGLHAHYVFLKYAKLRALERES